MNAIQALYQLSYNPTSRKLREARTYRAATTGARGGAELTMATTPPDDSWPPSSERAAASNLTAFVEWLRATGRDPDATPARCRTRAGRDADDWRQHVAAFAGLPAATTPAEIDAIAAALFADEAPV